MNDQTTVPIRADLMTDEERARFPFVFERIVRHAFTQNERAIEENGACCYRFYDGDRELKCFIGAVIDDEFYVDSLESSAMIQENLRRAVQQSLGLSAEPSRQFCELLNRIQRIHDHNDPVVWRVLLANERELLSDLLVLPLPNVHDIHDIVEWQKATGTV